MKEKLIMVVLTFSLTVNVTALITLGYFWGRDYRRGEAEKNAGGSSFGTVLSLDQGQRDRMRGLRRSFMAETAPVRDGLMIKRAELADLLTSEAADRTSLEQTLREINELQLKMQIAVIDQLFKEKEFLSPQQQERYADFISRKLCRDFLPGGKGHRRYRGREMVPQEGRFGGRGGDRRMRGHITRDQ